MLTMNSRVSKMMLTTHITFSVGWIGTVAAFLALSMVGLVSSDAVVRSCYVAMEIVAWCHHSILLCLSPNRTCPGTRNTLGTIQALVDFRETGTHGNRYTDIDTAHAANLLSC